MSPGYVHAGAARDRLGLLPFQGSSLRLALLRERGVVIPQPISDGELLKYQASSDSIVAGAAAATGGSLLFAQTVVQAGDTLANFTAETGFATTAVITANTLSVGQTVRVEAAGTVGTTGTPSIRLRLVVTGTTLLDTVDVALSGTNLGWRMVGLLIVDAIGATGSLEVHGTAFIQTGTSTHVVVEIPRTSGVTVDTTASLTLGMTAQWSAASASNTITQRQLAVWLDNTVAIGTASGDLTGTYPGPRINATANYQLNQHQALGFVVENRTGSDPASPVSGQLWFRTDL